MSLIYVDGRTCDFETDFCGWMANDSDSSIKLIRDYGGPGYFTQYLARRPIYDVTLGPKYKYGESYAFSK